MNNERPIAALAYSDGTRFIYANDPRVKQLYRCSFMNQVRQLFDDEEIQSIILAGRPAYNLPEITARPLLIKYRKEVIHKLRFKIFRRWKLKQRLKELDAVLGIDYEKIPN